MNKEVLLTITGLQLSQDDEDYTEMIAPGEYYFRGGKHYFLYEEVTEGFVETTKCTIKLDDAGKMMELTKKGVTNVHMIFEVNQKNDSFYYTPYGSLQIGIDGKKIEIEKGEDQMKVCVDYGLEMNYEHLANCKITILAKNRGSEGFRLVK